jgi:uncharacterized small protein (DUF1192 family)
LNGQIVINSSGKQMILGGFTSPVGGDVRGAIGTNATASGFGFNVPDPTTGLPVITVDTSGAFNTAILKAVQGGSIPGCTNFTGCVFLNSPAALRGDATSTTVGYGAFGVVGHSVNAIGVYGQSDLGNGVYGTTGGTIHTFAGVLGWATNKTAGNDPWAVYGGNDSDTGGAGGFISNSLTGSTLGVYGETKSDSGTAGSFYAKQNATGGGSTAVYGRAFGDFGVAGWFDATSTVGSAYAVWGRAHSASGVAGVFDVAPGASNGLALWARRCDYVNPCTSLFRVYSDGSAFISGSLTVNSTFYPSSRRFKTNIHTLSNALAMVERMRGVSYDLRSNGEHQIGVIAEEVGEVVPELVAYEANGKDARGVDYSRLTVLLIEAVKEQQEQIKAMQAEISGLKAKVAARERATQVADAR